MADAYGSGPYESNFMQVQVLLPAPNENNPNLTPIGDGFGFVYYSQYPNFNSKINKYIVMRFESRQRVYTYTLCLDFMLYFYDLVDFLFPSAVSTPHIPYCPPRFQRKQLYQAGNSLPTFQAYALGYRSVLPT